MTYIYHKISSISSSFLAWAWESTYSMSATPDVWEVANLWRVSATLYQGTSVTLHWGGWGHSSDLVHAVPALVDGAELLQVVAGASQVSQHAKHPLHGDAGLLRGQLRGGRAAWAQRVGSGQGGASGS